MSVSLCYLAVLLCGAKGFLQLTLVALSLSEALLHSNFTHRYITHTAFAHAQLKLDHIASLRQIWLLAHKGF